MEQFGVYIIPKGDLHQELEGLIAKYSREYNTPIFFPHITVLGRTTIAQDRVIRRVEDVAKNIQPFELQLGDVEFSTTYFQCVFVRIKTSASLLNVHLKVKKSIGDGENQVYMPHASIVYNNFDMETREKIAQEIQINNTRFKVSSLAIGRIGSDDPKDWEVVHEVNFK